MNIDECIKCNSFMHIGVSRNLDGRRRRKYECRSCGHWHVTYELRADENDNLVPVRRKSRGKPAPLRNAGPLDHLVGTKNQSLLPADYITDYRRRLDEEQRTHAAPPVATTTQPITPSQHDDTTSIANLFGMTPEQLRLLPSEEQADLRVQHDQYWQTLDEPQE